MTNKKMLEELANPEFLSTGCSIVFIGYLVMFVLLVGLIIWSGKSKKGRRE